MTQVVFLSLWAAAMAAQSAASADLPRGTLLELHSCELYAGGCIVSSEAPQGGRYMLRAWNFTGGTFEGVNLAGLKLALLQTSGDNLAIPGAKTAAAVVYLPEGTTGPQRTALVAWLKSTQPEVREEMMRTRDVPLRMVVETATCEFSAGDFLSVKAASLDKCATGSCGESLWYSPRSANSLFTVAVNQNSKVCEPLLTLKWEDSGKKSVFLGRFGENIPTSGLYVSLSDLCGPAGKLF